MGNWDDSPDGLPRGSLKKGDADDFPVPSELEELLRKAKARVEAMTPAERAEMFRQQAAGWAKSEAQWAKDFREGKCERD